MSENKARQHIDKLLTQAGWVVQDRNNFDRNSSLGVVCREFLTADRKEADYILFISGKAIGVIEAKKAGVSLSGIEGQSKGYSCTLPEYVKHYQMPLPFIYESNGEEIYFLDSRDPKYCAQRDVDAVVNYIKKQENVTIQVISNQSYFNCLEELREYASKNSSDLKNSSVLRFLQIEEFLSKHLNRLNRTSSDTTISNRNETASYKVEKRLPRWANNPEQYNHKIIRAFLEIENFNGYVTYELLSKLCADTKKKTTYVPNFFGNYSQMITDNGNSHGKVFDEIDDKVVIWDEIKPIFEQYRSSFK